MKSRDSILRFAKSAQWSGIFLAALRGVMWALPVLAVGGMVLSGLDHLFDVPLCLRQGLWIFVVGTSIGCFIASFFPLRNFSVPVLSANLAKNWRRKAGATEEGAFEFRQDDFWIGYEFSKPAKSQEWGSSGELKDEFLDHLATRIRSVSIFDSFPPWRWRKTFVLFFVSFVLSGSVAALFPRQFPLDARILFPFLSSRWDQYVRVVPGDAATPWGKDIQVRVLMLISTFNKPQLYVRSNDDWMGVEPESEMGSKQIYLFRNIVEPLHYRLRWKKEWGRKYTITPLKPIRIGHFAVSITPPDYLRQETLHQTSPEISALAGSLIEINARASAPLSMAKIAFSDGRERQVDYFEKDRLRIKFSIFNSGSYRFLLAPAESKQESMSEAYPLFLVEDQPPTVTLLSPEADLIVGESEKLPLTYSASDDFGIREVMLNWVKNGKDKNNRRIGHYEQSKDRLLFTYDWNLGNEDFSPGDVIQYQIVVLDGNGVTGPGRAESEWRTLELASFERSHEKMEEELEAWRDKAVDLLVEVNTVRAKTAMDIPDYNEMITEMTRAAVHSRELEKMLHNLVKLMEDDPLADYGMWLEHKAMEENLRSLNGSAFQEAQASLQTKNKRAALNVMDQVASELERMTALSDELSKSQKAQDIMEGGKSLAELGGDLVDQLEGGKLDPDVMNQIRKMVDEAHKILAEMAKSMANMPEELPEDFINQQALDDLEIGKTGDLLSQLMRAINDNDAQKALALANEFLKMAKNIQSQLDEAHESYVNENSAEELSKEIEAKLESLGQLTDQQRKILAKTQTSESKRLEAMLKAQEDLLSQLAKAQKRVLDRARKIRFDSPHQEKIFNGIRSQIQTMGLVYREFSEKKVEHSPEWLNEIVKGFDEIAYRIRTTTQAVPLSGEVEWLQAEESRILQELERPIPPLNPFSREDRKELKSLAEEQKQLMGETKELKEGLQTLARRTASLGIPLIKSLGGAAKDMQEAAGSLNSYESQKAQMSEEKALEKLQSSRDQLQQSQNAISGLTQQQRGGSRGGAGLRVIQRGRGGPSGVQTGKVRLPTVEDYRPPKKFREELLESLREKYPEVYEEIIHKYYKRLSE